MAEIELKRVTRAYGEHEGLFDFSLSLQKGQSFGLVGPTGSGKSTAVRLLAGLVRPDSGEASIRGLNCYAQRHMLMRDVGIAFTEADLPRRTSGDAFLRMVAAARGVVSRSRLQQVLERLDLNPLGEGARMTPDQRRKMMLALAILHAPDVLVLDEPCLGLNSHDRHNVLEMLNEERSKGRTVFMTTHVLEEAQRCCDIICILREGRAVTVQSAQAMTKTRQKVYHITFEDISQAAAFAQEWETGVELLRNRVIVTIPDSPQVLLKTLTKYTVMDLVGGRDTPEDSIVRAFGGDML